MPKYKKILYDVVCVSEEQSDAVASINSNNNFKQTNKRPHAKIRNTQ